MKVYIPIFRVLLFMCVACASQAAVAFADFDQFPVKGGGTLVIHDDADATFTPIGDSFVVFTISDGSAVCSGEYLNNPAYWNLNSTAPQSLGVLQRGCAYPDGIYRLTNIDATQTAWENGFFEVADGVGRPYAYQLCCSNVAFLPGLEASRLYSGKTGAKLWEPFTDGDVQKLDMNRDGTSIDPSIVARDPLDRFKAFGIPGPSIYGSFMQKMNDLAAQGTINSWKAFPYDWRQSVETVVTPEMTSSIENLAAMSQTKKVTIIAHSNGGLIAKMLMTKLAAAGKANLVDRIIFVGVPQLGTPDAIASLLHGVNIPKLTGIIMNATTSRVLAENMPSVYGLLPSSLYFQNTPEPSITFDASADEIGPYTGTYGDGIRTLNNMEDFLLGKEGRVKPLADNTTIPNVLNAALLAQAQQLHEVLDSWEVPRGVSAIQLAGWGIKTLKSIAYKGKYPCTALIIIGPCKPFLDETPQFTDRGDGTVVTESATAMPLAESRFVDLATYNRAAHANFDHKSLLEVPPVQDFLSKEITDTADEDSPYITESPRVIADGSESIAVAMHSPATIDLYDAEGNHTGPIPSASPDVTQYEENIPNSYYTEFGEAKYAGFDDAPGNTIKIQGTGAGTFTVSVDHVDNDCVVKSETFADIPVTPDTKAEIIPSDTSASTLSLDADGNGTVDATIQPTGDDDANGLEPATFLQIMKQSIHALGLPQKTEQQLDQKIDKAIKLATKDKKKKLLSVIRQFETNVREKKWKKSKKMSQDQKDALLQMLGTLLDAVK